MLQWPPGRAQARPAGGVRAAAAVRRESYLAIWALAGVQYTRWDRRTGPRRRCGEIAQAIYEFTR